jgi:DNA polymerase-1
MRGQNKWSEEAKAYRKAEGSVRRQAMNYPMQGLCVDIVKVAVADYRERTRHGRLVAIVHDELVVEAPTEHAETEATLLCEVMGNACRRFLTRVSIPEIEVHVGERWEH